MRRVRSGEHIVDLGTKPLGKAVIAKHCLTMGYVNMNEEMIRASVESWRCSGTSNHQRVTMSRRQPAEAHRNRSSRSIRSSGSKQTRRSTKCLREVHALDPDESELRDERVG